jgi:hypothetical protein
MERKYMRRCRHAREPLDDNVSGFDAYRKLPKQSMNWVEKRLAQERSLEDGTPGVWNKIRTAIQDACHTYYESSGTAPERTVKCELENGKRIRTDRSLRQRDGDGRRDKEISVVASNNRRLGSQSLKPAPSAPRHTEFPLTKHPPSLAPRVRPDAMSQAILEPLLYPTGTYTSTKF